MAALKEMSDAWFAPSEQHVNRKSTVNAIPKWTNAVAMIGFHCYVFDQSGIVIYAGFILFLIAPDISQPWLLSLVLKKTQGIILCQLPFGSHKPHPISREKMD